MEQKLNTITNPIKYVVHRHILAVNQIHLIDVVRHHSCSLNFLL